MKREYMLDDVIAAISTPIGTGGIGIVRMSGAGCRIGGQHFYRQKEADGKGNPYLILR